MVTGAASKIAFIGGGNMSQAILGGLLATGQSSADCLVVDPDEMVRAKLAASGIVTFAAFDERLLAANKFSASMRSAWVTLGGA